MSKIFVNQLIIISFLVTFFSCSEERVNQPDSPLSVDLSAPTLNETVEAITVVGQNNPAVDPNAVQSAVDQYQTVTLQGTFNFGTDGGVLITQPNVTLKGPATINGGGARYWFKFAIGINAPGVKVSDLTINTLGNANGILVTSMGGTQATGDDIIIENNTITSGGWQDGILLVLRGGLPVLIKGNTINAYWGIEDLWTGYTLDQNGEIAIPVDQSGQRIFAPLDIMNNNITVDGYWSVGVTIYGWPNQEGELQIVPENVLPLNRPAPPDWGDNGPVNVTGNRIHLNVNNTFSQGIAIALSASGINNCTVSNNTLVGDAWQGIVKLSYGRDNVITGNDLSGLTTTMESVVISASNTTCTNNIMGPSLSFAALSLWSVNWHPNYPPPWNTPMPAPIENCVIEDNDYRGTGLQGWDGGFGCILIFSDKDRPLVSGISTEVKNNFIKETGRFPEGTGGPSKQILEFVGENGLVYNNTIIGHPANKLSSGIGKQFKELRQQRIQNPMMGRKDLSLVY